MHLSTSISTSKAPMDLAALSIAFAGQSFNMLPKMLKAFDTFGQTSPLKNADLDLSHVQPTAMLRRVMDLQSFPDALCFLGRECLVEATHRMSIEIVHDQTDHPSIRIGFIHQPTDRLSNIQSSTSVGHLDAASPRQGLDEEKQVGCSQALIFIIRTLRRSWFHRQRLTDLSMHHQRLFIKTDQRRRWIIWLGIQIQHVFHGRHKGSIDVWNAPMLMLPRF